MTQKTLLYYIDGYHGGIRGHMPLGCWRDILDALKRFPEWKLCIDVEPVSWDELLSRDPESYEELSGLLHDVSVSSRLEIVSGSYGQPYGWITDGESNIRHLIMGLELVHKHFPWIKVSTYAAQEPCWTSALPQILRSLGFKQAVLKNPSTAWGGYCRGFDAETCLWEGPDGTQIPLVPRYACEDLKNTWETESVDGTESFAAKCVTHGIRHPAGMIFQDLGWPADSRLRINNQEPPAVPEHIIHTTWKEYFEAFAEKPEEVWKVSQEDILGALPWGERLLSRMSEQVRRGEKMMLQCERIHALSAALTGVSVGIDRIREAWGHVLMTQHHDAWICTSLRKNEENWAWKTSAQIYAAESLIAPIQRDAMLRLAGYGNETLLQESQHEAVCAANLSGRTEELIVSLPVTSHQGVKSFRVFDGNQYLTAQYCGNRYFSDGTKNAGILYFRAVLPSFGIKSFNIEPRSGEVQVQSAWTEPDFAYLETDIYKLKFNLKQGGTISSFIDKTQNLDLIDPQSSRKFNEYSGYFIKEGAFFSSADQPAVASVIESGPVYAAMEIRGTVGSVEFVQQISAWFGEKRIDFRVNFHFPDDTYIGDPHEIVPPDNKLDRHRSYHDGRYKLNAWFPTRFPQKHLDKDAAYDVCRSRETDNHFTDWDQIKHNVIVGWADVTDSEHGLAVFSDRTTSYIHTPETQLGLTMAWGWDAGYWWGRRKLKGDQTINYSLISHSGDWEKGDIWHEYQKMLFKPVTQRFLTVNKSQHQCELISIQPPAELSATYMISEKQMIVRIFNPGDATCVGFRMNADFIFDVSVVELDGSIISKVPLVLRDKQWSGSMDMPRFAVRSLLIDL